MDDKTGAQFESGSDSRLAGQYRENPEVAIAQRIESSLRWIDGRPMHLRHYLIGQRRRKWYGFEAVQHFEIGAIGFQFEHGSAIALPAEAG